MIHLTVYQQWVFRTVFSPRNPTYRLLVVGIQGGLFSQQPYLPSSGYSGQFVLLATTLTVYQQCVFRVVCSPSNPTYRLLVVCIQSSLFSQQPYLMSTSSVYSGQRTQRVGQFLFVWNRPTICPVHGNLSWSLRPFGNRPQTL